jgi:hypothetical protein
MKTVIFAFQVFRLKPEILPVLKAELVFQWAQKVYSQPIMNAENTISIAIQRKSHTFHSKHIEDQSSTFRHQENN